jgi:hypothetical protein
MNDRDLIAPIILGIVLFVIELLDLLGLLEI